MPESPDPAPAAASADWAAQTADSIEKLVDTLRSSTSDRLVSLARLVVLGLLAFIMGLSAFVLGTIGAVRALDTWLPGGVWAADVLLGAIFSLVGLFLWSKRTTRS